MIKTSRTECEKRIRIAIPLCYDSILYYVSVIWSDMMCLIRDCFWIQLFLNPGTAEQYVNAM